MKITTTQKLKKLDSLILFKYKDKIADNGMFDKPSLQTINAIASSKTKAGYITNKDQTVFLCVVDLKKSEKNEIRRGVAQAVQAIKKNEVTDVAVVVPDFGKDIDENLTEIVESVILTDYKFDRYLSEKNKSIEELSLIFIKEDKKAKDIIKKAEITATYVNMTRDLINTPPTDLNPSKFEKICTKEAKEHSIKMTVFDKKELLKKGMNCLSSVSDGSSEDSRMIILEYKPKNAKNKKPIVLVGKGITYDAGGINLKPSRGGFLESMKDDMGGSATVFATILACQKLELPVHVISILAIAENMLGESAYKPGDVLKAYNGKTIEVKNTDAEGRLALADALSYATKDLDPEVIIDIATLTGASIMSLGWDITPVLGNDEKLISKLKKSSINTSEKIWELPLDECYSRYMKGDISDLKNITDGMNAGVSTSAIFLKEFVSEKTPWIHIDIGNTVLSKRDYPYEPKGATGCIVRLFIDFLSKY